MLTRKFSYSWSSIEIDDIAGDPRRERSLHKSILSEPLTSEITVFDGISIIVVVLEFIMTASRLRRRV
jgi:hypothetical protein